MPGTTDDRPESLGPDPTPAPGPAPGHFSQWRIRRRPDFRDPRPQQDSRAPVGPGGATASVTTNPAGHQQSVAFRYPAFSASASLAKVMRFFSAVVAAPRHVGL